MSIVNLLFDENQMRMSPGAYRHLHLRIREPGTQYHNYTGGGAMLQGRPRPGRMGARYSFLKPRPLGVDWKRFDRSVE